MVDMARNIAGRIVFNGVPTGVEVTNATVHSEPTLLLQTPGTDHRHGCYQKMGEAFMLSGLP